MSLSAYEGRTIDVFAYEQPSATGRSLLVPALATEGGGLVCTGIQKLVQKFLIEFFTERGSIPYEPTRGSTFLTDMYGGRVRNQADVFGAVARALVYVETNLLSDETDATPDDERYAGAEILAVTIAETSVDLTLKISSEAGDSRQYILPLPLNL